MHKKDAGSGLLAAMYKMAIKGTAIAFTLKGKINSTAQDIGHNTRTARVNAFVCGSFVFLISMETRAPLLPTVQGLFHAGGRLLLCLTLFFPYAAQSCALQAEGLFLFHASI